MNEQQTIKTIHDIDGKPTERQSIVAYQAGVWAATLAPKIGPEPPEYPSVESLMWTVTHAPSGMSVTSGCGSHRAGAVELATVLHARWPDFARDLVFGFAFEKAGRKQRHGEAVGDFLKEWIANR